MRQYRRFDPNRAADTRGPAVGRLRDQSRAPVAVVFTDKSLWSLGSPICLSNALRPKSASVSILVYESGVRVGRRRRAVTEEGRDHSGDPSC